MKEVWVHEDTRKRVMLIKAQLGLKNEDTVVKKMVELYERWTSK